MSTTKIDHRLQKIQSLFRQRDYKKAYKEAVFVAKQSGNSEVHSFMVSSLWEWIKEQYQRNQFSEAKANIQELLRFSDIPAAIQAEFPPIFRVLGLNSLLPEESRQDTSSPEIQIELADLYLLKGNKTGDLLPETLQDAERIRLAFEKIESKQDEEAIELLRPISFRSPLADWRLFLRGLIDHYHGDDNKSEESWKRLSPARPPARIAAKLKNLLLVKPSESPVSSGGVIAGFFNMFRSKSSPATSPRTELLETLRVLDGYMKQGKDKELLGRFQSSKPLFQQEMPTAFARLFRIVHDYIIRNSSPSTVKQFVDRNLPLPLDPKGNRTLAYLSQLVDHNPKHRRPNWLAFPPVYWKKFAEEDIDRIESFSPQVKARAKAIVYDFMAKQTHDEYLDTRAEAGSEEVFHTMIDVPQTVKEIEDLLEKSISCDPTFQPAYAHLERFFLERLPEDEQKKRFHPRLVEINERLLRHVSDAEYALEYLFEYHLDAKNTNAAQGYYERLCGIDPLSRKTLIRRSRFCLGGIRDGLRQRDFDHVNAAFRELDNGPLLESFYYRFDVIPLALAYIRDVLQGNDSGGGDYFAAAERLGIEKRLPLIFAILAEGRELDLPPGILEPFQKEWDKTISGRCNGNIAGALGDSALNYIVLEDRFPKAKSLVREACDFVNRSGQVKWNCEKDIFGACHLLWHLSVKQETDEYEKTYRTLAKKMLKQFPNSPFGLFFSAETYWLEDTWFQFRLAGETIGMYREFLKRAASLRDDPGYSPYIAIAETRLPEIQLPPWELGDDCDDDYDDEYGDYDDDFDDPPIGVPGYGIPSSIQRLVKQNGGFPKNIRKELEQSFPSGSKLLCKLVLDTAEECIIKDLAHDQFMVVLERKMDNLSFFDKLKLMAAMATSGFLSGDKDDDDDPVPSRKKQHKKR
jgi:hypothetical protein